jgi:hypothetical protein
VEIVELTTPTDSLALRRFARCLLVLLTLTLAPDTVDYIALKTSMWTPHSRDCAHWTLESHHYRGKLLRSPAARPETHDFIVESETGLDTGGVYLTVAAHGLLTPATQVGGNG